jgi:hypothetical protein
VVTIVAKATLCPHCNADLRGSPIPVDYIRKGYYGPPDNPNTPTHYSRIIGVEIRGVYDGTLFWACPDCFRTWSRWPKDTSDRLYNLGELHRMRWEKERGLGGSRCPQSSDLS